MKKSFLILSILSVTSFPALASVQMNFAPSSSSTQSHNSLSLGSDTPSITDSQRHSFSNSDDIDLMDSLETLTVQAQQREDQLAILADTLTIATPAESTTTSFATSNNTVTRSRVDSSAPPAIAAAKAARTAHSRTKGLCARYVRKALQAAGYSFTPNPSAYQYATRGTLSQAGFVKISNDSPPQVGDVVVFNRTSRHRHGHIQIFDGSKWVSDFIQPDKTPYSDNFSYTTWRDARYLNNASNEGIYLAMED